MKIIFLGTGHGSATASNMSSVTYLECGGKTYLVDCADGTDAVMMKKHLEPSKLSAIFITHWHIDHTGGLPVVIKRFKADGPNLKLVLPELSAVPLLEQWMALQGALQEFDPESEKKPFTCLDSLAGFNDGNMELKAFPTQHLADEKRPSYAYTLRSEGKKLCFTGDLRGDCSDFPFAAANGCDLVVSELTHFRLHHIWPFLEKLQIGALVFNHIGNWSQVPEEQSIIIEKCKKLPYPVTIAFDGMEYEL